MCFVCMRTCVGRLGNISSPAKSILDTLALRVRLNSELEHLVT